ncbi:MAG: type II toxin-antitoxin system Phd/YefM family antitoxin [Bacteroidetes bacterium]|nr:type II toxin-antitoxin system Phd/YefM family antitoxin [Bacteroidota bacterium]
MRKSVTYTHARETLASLCDEVVSTREPAIITRRDKDDVALVAADELSGLLETAHLLRSDRNAQRLLKALLRARAGKGRPASVEQLRRRAGLGAEEA